MIKKATKGPGPKKAVMPGSKLQQKATSTLAARKKENDKKRAAEMNAAKMTVGIAATRNKPNFNTKGVVVKAKRPSHLK